MRNIILAVLLLIAATFTARADERRLASLNALTAVAPSGFQCADSASIVIRAPNEAAFQGDRRDIQRLLGGVRASLGFECPKLSTLMVQGEAAGQPVYRGVLSKDTSWVLVDIQRVEDKPAAAEASAQPRPGFGPSSSLPPVAVLPVPSERGPSFPCAAAQKPVEHLICGNDRLSALDRQLEQAYKNVNGSASSTIHSAQNAWIRQRDRCRTPDCAASLYESRIAELATSSAQQTASQIPPAENNAPGTPSAFLPGPPSSSGTVPASNAATPEQFCSRAEQWAQQLEPEATQAGALFFSDMGRRWPIVSEAPLLFAGLVRDSYFVPYFGKSYDSMTDEDAKVMLKGARTCLYGVWAGKQTAGGEFIDVAFNRNWAPRNPEGRRAVPPQNAVAFQAARQKLASSSAWLTQASGTLTQTPATPDGLRTASTIERDAQAYLPNVWPSERTAYKKTIEDRMSAIVDQLVVEHSSGGPALADLISLEQIATGLDDKTATRIRERVNALLQQRLASGNTASQLSNADLMPFAAYPAVRSTRPGLGSDPSTSLDRAVWSGRYKCGPSAIKADLVVLGTPTQPSSAYLLVDADSSSSGISLVSPAILEYSPSYDSVLDGLKLTFRRWGLQSTGILPPKQLDLSYGSLQTIVRGRADPSCDEFALHKSEYPKPLIAAVIQLRKNAAWKPPATLANAPDQDSFCLAAAAWAMALDASGTGRDYSRPLGSDDASRMFKASVLYPSFAKPYMGRDLTELPPADPAILQTMNRIQACQLHPLFFEHRAIFSFFYNSLNQAGRKEDVQKLRDIDAKAARIISAADRFSPDLEGLTRLIDYVTPLEAGLVGAVPEVRNTILSPAWKRETEIATAVLKNDLDQSGLSHSLDQLQALDVAVQVVKIHATLVPDSGSFLSRAEAKIGTDLETLLTAELQPVQDAAPTLDGLVQLKARRVMAATKFAKLSAYSTYQTALAVADTRVMAIQREVAEGLARQVAQAPDADSIRKIRASIDKFQSNNKDKSLTAPLWTSYRSGLTEWFSAAVSKAPQTVASDAVPLANPVAPAPPASPNPLGDFANLPSSGTRAISAFLSPNLKEANLVSSIYKKDFRAIYRQRDRTQDYIVAMLKVIGPACPGSISADFMSSIMKEQLGPDILSDPSKAGADILMGMFKRMADMNRNPGGTMNQMLKDGEFSGRAQADANTILQVTPCNDPALSTFLSNAREFFANPAAGIPVADLGMDDICRAAQPEYEAQYLKDKYCSCAGPVFEQSLNPTEKSFVRLSPRPNFWDALQLVPDLQEKAQKCAL